MSSQMFCRSRSALDLRMGMVLITSPLKVMLTAPGELCGVRSSILDR